MATIGLNTAEVKDRARNILGRDISEAEAQSLLSSAWDQSQWGADEGTVIGMLQQMRGGSGGGGGGGAIDPDQYLQSIKDQLQAQFDEFLKRGEEFDQNNPFSFDEALARASAEQRYNPYYEAELSDFTAGINSQRQSVEGEKNLAVQLNTIQTGADQRNLEEAIKQSEQGYTDVGLFFSGARQRATGLLGIEGAERAEERGARYQFGQEEYGRRVGDITRAQATGKRKFQAAKTTDIESELARQKAEERARHEYEKAQYVGYPYVQPTQGLEDLLSRSFTV